MTDLLMTVGTVLISLVTAYFVGRRVQRNIGHAKEAERRVAAKEAAQEVRDEIEVLDDTQLVDRARGWVRKAD